MPRSVGSKGAPTDKTALKVFGPAINFRAAFITIFALALPYGIALLAVLYAYRKARDRGEAPTSAKGRGNVLG